MISEGDNTSKHVRHISNMALEPESSCQIWYLLILSVKAGIGTTNIKLDIVKIHLQLIPRRSIAGQIVKKEEHLTMACATAFTQGSRKHVSQLEEQNENRAKTLYKSVQ